MTLRCFRRLSQFRLRTVLVATAVLAVCLGTWLDRGRREKAAVEALCDKGYVGIRYDPCRCPDGTWWKMDADGEWVNADGPLGPEWLRNWLGEHYFTRVVGISSYSSVLDDEAMPHVAQLHQIRLLRNDVMMVSVAEAVPPWTEPCVPGLNQQGRLTDKGLAHLKNLTHLETLVLIWTDVTNDGLQHLRRLQRLKRLKISSRRITDRGIPHLLRLGSLENLCVSGTSISEAGVAALRRALPKCQVVGPADVPKKDEDRLGIYER